MSVQLKQHIAVDRVLEGSLHESSHYCEISASDGRFQISYEERMNDPVDFTGLLPIISRRGLLYQGHEALYSKDVTCHGLG